MIKVFVLDVLESLQQAELEELRLFLKSPYFNRGHNSVLLAQLFEILLESIQKGSIDGLEKQDVYLKLFPGKPLVDSKIDKLMSELKGLVQHFLVAQHSLNPKNTEHSSIALLRELRQRGLETRYHQAFERIKKEVDSVPWESTSAFHFLHLIEMEEHEWNSTFNKSKGDLNIPQVLRNLDLYAASLKTEMLNRLLIQQRQAILNEDAKNIIESPWSIPKEILEQSTLIDTSWQIYQILKENTPQIAAFYDLLKILQLREKKILPETLAEYYTYLRNICIGLVNSTHTEFFEVLHAIQKDNLERGYYYFQGKISPGAYLNITQIALSVQAFDWAAQFVENHKDSIISEPEETADFYRLNKALCFFAEKKYDDALSILPFGSSYSAYHLTARRLELKIYYELKSDLLEFKIDAFKMFISRAGQKVLSKNLYETFVNFINILRQLNQSMGIQDKNRSEQLIKRIQEKALLADRPWLLEKAREIGERKK